MAAHVFSSVEPPLFSPSRVAGDGGGRRRRSFRPCLVATPARDSHAMADGFDFQEGLKSVKGMLHQNHKENRKVMTDIDHLKRLCIDHYFQDEIDDGMDACLNLVHSDDLLDATLSLRLLREAGHDISADEVLQKFVNENDDFNLDHTKDIRGLLSLQDISHLNMGEASLYKANDFSRKHLTSAIKHLDLNLARYVRHSLDHPYHVSLTQYKARHHLSYLQSLPTRNTAMEELALADFQLNKLQHQMEMQEVKRWWMGLGLAQEIPATRDQILKWYMFPMTILQGQSFSRYRIEITKIIAIVSIVDDIFDVIATQEELSRFTEAIKMWDLAAAASLPSYMRSCYSALYTITNDIADMAEREHGLNPIDHLKKDWTMLFDAFLLEAKWLSANQVPSLDDYLSNGVVTTGGPLALVHLFSMLGHDPTRDATNLTAQSEQMCDAAAAVVAARQGMEQPLTAVAEAFEELARGMEADGGELRLAPFGDTCALVSVLFNSLGIAFKFAESEYVTKVNDLIGASREYATLNDILDKDVENDSVKKQGSHSRNLRRVRLGLGLIKALFEQFLATEGGSLYDAATTAYGQVCAPFHSWAIRKAVGAGMYTLPSREQLIMRLNETDCSVQKEMRRYIDASSPIIVYIDNLFLSRNIVLDW